MEHEGAGDVWLVMEIRVGECIAWNWPCAMVMTLRFECAMSIGTVLTSCGFWAWDPQA